VQAVSLQALPLSLPVLSSSLRVPSSSLLVLSWSRLAGFIDRQCMRSSFKRKAASLVDKTGNA
jgi:hypothetical protein